VKTSAVAPINTVYAEVTAFCQTIDHIHTLFQDHVARLRNACDHIAEFDGDVVTLRSADTHTAIWKSAAFVVRVNHHIPIHQLPPVVLIPLLFQTNTLLITPVAVDHAWYHTNTQLFTFTDVNAQANAP